MKDVGTVIALAKFCPKAFGEAVDDALAVVGSPFPGLFFLDDNAAYLSPSMFDHSRVDRMPGTTSGRSEDFTDLAVEHIKPGVGRRRVAGLEETPAGLDRCLLERGAFLRHAKDIPLILPANKIDLAGQFSSAM